MIYVEFMKNFLLADSSELIAVRLISASWAQKRLIPTFWTWCTSSSWKIFFSPIRASWWLLDSFRPPEPKNVWFLLSRHDVRRVDEKFSSRSIRATWWLLDSFRPPEPKNVWFSTFWAWCTSSSCKIFFSPIRASWSLLDSFRPPEPKNDLLSRHDVHRVHDSNKLLAVTHFGLLSRKTFHSYFLDMMYVEFMKIFFSPIRASWWLLDSFRPPEPKNVWFLLSGHDVRRVDEKFSSRRFERADGC